MIQSLISFRSIYLGAHNQTHTLSLFAFDHFHRCIDVYNEVMPLQNHQLPSFERVFGFRTTLSGETEITDTDFLQRKQEEENLKPTRNHNSSSFGRWYDYT
jgi:hypothetical protein